MPHKIKPEEVKMTLFHLASTYGCVLTIRMCDNRRVKKMLGQAWITFKTQKEAEMALKRMNGFNVLGRKIQVSYS